MITLKYYPERFGKKCKKRTLRFKRSKLLKDYLAEAGYQADGNDIIVEGKAFERVDVPIDNQSEIIVTPKVELEAIGAAVGWLIGKFAEHWITYTILLLASSYSIYSAVSASMRMRNFGTNGLGIDESSPTYGWDGIRTIQEVGAPVKIVHGRHRTGGNIINQFISSDGDKQYLNLLIAGGEGPIKSISSIQLNGNPIENYTDVEVTTRLGTNDQTVIPGFEDLHNVYNINAQLLKNASYVYTTVDSDVEGFDLYFTLPGLYQVGSSGAFQSWAVTYRVEYKLHTDEEYTDLGEVTISGKSQTTVRRNYRKDGLAAGQYDIRITRTSDDSSADPQKSGDLYLASVDEIITDDLEYPNTVLVAIKALATNQLSGSTPNVTWIEEALLVSAPAVLTAEGGDLVDWEDYYYDPEDEVFRLFADDSALYWDGETFVDQWCANPIWCLKNDMLNTRYGTGEHVTTDNIDADEMLTEALYCETKVPDGAGGYEKRFRLDAVLDSRTDLPDILTQFTAAFRAFPFHSQNGYSFKIDRPVDVDLPYKQIFGMGNLVKGQFQQGWKSKNEIYNWIEAQFCDQDNNYEDETIVDSGIEAGDPIRPKTLRIFATKKSYVLRETRYARLVAKYINRSISLRCFPEALACKVGDVIGVSHDVPQWGYSGRVKTGSTTTSVKLDREVTVEAGKTYHLLVRFSDNSWQEKVVTNAAGTYSEITVSEAFSQAPADYDVYSFGEVDKVVKPFTVLNIERDRQGEVDLRAIEYNAGVYDDTAVVIPTNNYSALSAAIPVVTDLALTERIITHTDGTVEMGIDVWFAKPDISSHYVNRYTKARIYLSDNAGASHEVRGETDGDHFTIVGNLEAGVEYLITVVSLAGTEEAPFATAPADTITLTGKGTAPATVANFAYTFLDEIKLTWDKNAETDIAGYEIRDEDDDWGVNNSHRIYLGLATTHTIVRPASRTPGTYYIKAFNTSGNYSTTAATVVPTNDAPATPTIAATQWFGFAKIEWTALTDADLKRCEVYKSHTNAWAGEEFCHMVVDGRGVAALVQGNAPVDVVAASPDSTSITDANLIGKGVDYFVGDVVIQTSGDYSGQQAIVTGFDNDTGKVTVASWPSGTPTAGDQFVIKDRAYYKVRGVDSFGPGSFSAGVTIDFTPLTEAEIGDAIISARKLIAGEVITLSAQIKDLIVTSAKILELDGGKIIADSIQATSIISVPAGKLTAGTIEAITLILGTGGVFQSQNYVKGVSGFKLDATDGLEMNDGAVNAEIVLIGGARLRDQYVVTAQSKTESQDSGQWENGTKSGVTVADGKLKLSSINTAGSFISQILDCGAAPKYGTIQWDEDYHAVTNDVARDGTATAYKSGGGAGQNPSYAIDGNDVTYANWGDGTDWWGQHGILEVDLGSAKDITSFRVLCGGSNAIPSQGWKLQYSDDGGIGGTWVDATPMYYSYEVTGSLNFGAHRYWRWYGGLNAQYHDNWQIFTLELRITNTSNPDIEVQVRTSPNADMSSPTDWSDALTNPAGSNIDVLDQRYIQYKISFTTNSTTKDYIEVDNIKINYDNVEPVGYGKVKNDSDDTEPDYLEAKLAELGVGGPPTQVNDTDAGTEFGNTETTFLTVNKTITSGKTVLLIAAGYGYQTTNSADDNIEIKLKHGTTAAQTVKFLGEYNKNRGWAAVAMVTGLSGAVTFSVTAKMATSVHFGKVFGDLVVQEF